MPAFVIPDGSDPCTSIASHGQTRTNYGDRSFTVQETRTWNSLPADLRASDISVETFRHKLNFLFAV